MNLTILTQYYPPEIGAPQARLSELAQRIAARGHQVSILTAMPNYPKGKIYEGYGGIIKRETVGGIRIIRTSIYPTQKTSFIQRMSNYLSFVASSALLGSFYLPKTDYLLVESPPLFLGLSSWWLSLVRRSRIIFNVSDLWPESAVRLGVVQKGSLSYRISEKLEALCYHFAWLITGQSRSILSSIQARFPKRQTYHLSNGADTQKFHPNRKTPQARSTLGGERECVAFYAGLHGLAQGLDQIVDAAQILQTDHQVRFLLMGDGPEKGNLVRCVEQKNLTNIRFMSPRPSEEVPPLVASADIILVTLKLHIPGAVPSKIYEAMASARPVILVAEGEAADIIRQHDAGIVVSPGDISGLVDALNTLKQASELRQRLGANGRRAAEQYFNRDIIASNFISYLESSQ